MPPSQANGTGRTYMLRPLWILSFGALFFVGVAHADTTYWRVTMDRMTVVSDGGGERCSRLATQLTIFERLLRELAGWSADYQPPPIALYSLSQPDARRVLLSDADRRQQSSSNMHIYSKFLPGHEFNIAAIVDEGGSDDPLESVLLLYAEGALISGPTQHYPPWFQLGVANVMNGLMVREDGSVILNRNVPFEPVDSKGGGVHMQYDLLKLLQARAGDLNAGADYKEFMRAAREWAQFGLLTTQQRRAQYHDLATLMRQGTPAADAVNDAFGVPFEQVAGEFRAAAWRKEAQFRVTPQGAPVSVPKPEKLDAQQTNILLQVVATRATPAPAERN
jgi:hypothetical protein